ncbi:dihydrofolate reductase family protein [Streptomyces rubiginosohelvolus]|uniref:dihydrofolate reductase family protein n=1 Tax=Streptomyces rubiginosohelvolus TaxID=67362 RepID=UPI0037950550
MTGHSARVTCDLSISVDGYSAGLDQSEQRPFGEDGGDGWGGRLHSWMFATPELRQAELDRLETVGAFIMGRNMFGPVSALRRAREAAGDRDVSIHGGARTINQYLAGGLIDELRLHIVPFTLSAGTRLFDGVPPLDLEQVETRTGDAVTHVTYRVLP